MKIGRGRQGPPSPAAARHPLPLNGGEGFKSEFTSPLARRGGRRAGGEGWSAFSSQAMRCRRMMSVNQYLVEIELGLFKLPRQGERLYRATSTLEETPLQPAVAG